MDNLTQEEELSSDGSVHTSDCEFMSETDDDLGWVIDPELTRPRTAEELDRGSTQPGMTMGMQRFANAIASIERRATALEAKRVRTKQARAERAN